MPAQKRSAEPVVAANSVEDDDPLLLNLGNYHEQQRRGKTEDADADDESDRSPFPCNEQKQEYVLVKLCDIRKELQCPICLGIIRKTRTVMECLHRFCRECIDKSMRIGNNECPACRTHCASRRSLRDDPNYDALISALYPDIDKYEEEELAFNEDEKSRNKQIQVSIAQTLHRQSEALGRKRMVKGTTTAIISRSQSRYGGKRKYRASEPQESDNIEDADGDGSKDSSSADEQHTEVKRKRSKRWVRFSSNPTSATSADGDGDENDTELNRESLGASAALVWPTDRLHWGAGGIRSNTQHGNGGNGKNSRNSHLSKLVDCLQNLEEKDNESPARPTLNMSQIAAPEAGMLWENIFPWLFGRPSGGVLGDLHLTYQNAINSVTSEDMDLMNALPLMTMIRSSIITAEHNLTLNMGVAQRVLRLVNDVGALRKKVGLVEKERDEARASHAAALKKASEDKDNEIVTLKAQVTRNEEQLSGIQHELVQAQEEASTTRDRLREVEAFLTIAESERDAALKKFEDFKCQAVIAEFGIDTALGVIRKVAHINFNDLKDEMMTFPEIIPVDDDKISYHYTKYCYDSDLEQPEDPAPEGSMRGNSSNTDKDNEIVTLKAQVTRNEEQLSRVQHELVQAQEEASTSRDRLRGVEAFLTIAGSERDAALKKFEDFQCQTVIAEFGIDTALGVIRKVAHINFNDLKDEMMTFPEIIPVDDDKTSYHYTKYCYDSDLQQPEDPAPEGSMRGNSSNNDASDKDDEIVTLKAQLTHNKEQLSRVQRELVQAQEEASTSRDRLREVEAFLTIAGSERDAALKKIEDFEAEALVAVEFGMALMMGLPPSL